MFALSEFDIRYKPARAVKGQALADLITERSAPQQNFIGISSWALFFDGSACDAGCGVGLLIISPRGAQYEFAFRLSERCTNN